MPDDGVVVTTSEGEASVWDSLLTFHKAPCLKQSLALGSAGGVGIGSLRFATYRHVPSALTWGAMVGGLLACSSWFVCRRSLYSSVQEEVQLLQRVMAKDPEAIREYQAKLEMQAKRDPSMRESQQ